MTITRTASPVSESTERSPHLRGRRGLKMALLIGIVVLVLAGLAGWLFVNGTSHSAQPASVGASEPLSPYAEGGSVYREQVPAAATVTANPYSEGGSVYREQVPAAATVTADPYAEGGSVYHEQVPEAATTQ